jgi:hypothetical protein
MEPFYRTGSTAAGKGRDFRSVEYEKIDLISVSPTRKRGVVGSQEATQGTEGGENGGMTPPQRFRNIPR